MFNTMLHYPPARTMAKKKRDGKGGWQAGRLPNLAFGTCESTGHREPRATTMAVASTELARSGRHQGGGQPREAGARSF